MRLIDADKMIADLLTVNPQYETMINWCITVINAQPTIEPQPEIVRCKDCTKREICRTSTVWAVAPGDGWYCADAERRTDEQNS